MGEIMKMKVLLLILPMFMIATVYSASISVSKPNGGTFTESSSLQIVWIANGITGNVKINLRKSDGSGGAVIQTSYPANKLSYSYSLASVTPGKYFIKIKQGVVFGVSSIFDVISNSEPIIPSYIKILTPSGNKDLFTGQNVLVKWDFAGSAIDSKIMIDLYKGVTKIINIIPSVTINDKMLNWTIPTSLKSGKYQIKIVTKNGKVKANSSVITINKLSVVKPPTLQGQITVTAKPVQGLTYSNINNSRTDLYDKRKPVNFYSPKLGFVWKPLKDYNIEFEVYKKNGVTDIFLSMLC